MRGGQLATDLIHQPPQGRWGLVEGSFKCECAGCRYRSMRGDGARPVGHGGKSRSPRRLADGELPGTSTGGLLPPAGAVAPAEVKLDHVGSVGNAAMVISRLHRGEKHHGVVDPGSRIVRGDVGRGPAGRVVAHAQAKPYRLPESCWPGTPGSRWRGNPGLWKSFPSGNVPVGVGRFLIRQGAFPGSMNR